MTVWSELNHPKAQWGDAFRGHSFTNHFQVLQTSIWYFHDYSIYFGRRSGHQLQQAESKYTLTAHNTDPRHTPRHTHITHKHPHPIIAKAGSSCRSKGKSIRKLVLKRAVMVTESKGNDTVKTTNISCPLTSLCDQLK